MSRLTSQEFNDRIEEAQTIIRKAIAKQYATQGHLSEDQWKQEKRITYYLSDAVNFLDNAKTLKTQYPDSGNPQ